MFDLIYFLLIILSGFFVLYNGSWRSSRQGRLSFWAFIVYWFLLIYILFIKFI